VSRIRHLFSHFGGANKNNTTYNLRWFTLAALCGSLLAVMLANSSLNLALPTMAVDLQLSSLDMTWIVEIYSLVFAGLLFVSGAVGDRYGRTRIMQTGLLLFVLSALFAGFFAASATELIVARALMGVGAAMVMPTTLSIINIVFPAGERSKAIAIWSGVAGAGIMFGSVMSGFLLEHFGWQSPFVFSAVIGVAGLIANRFLTKESRDEHKTPIDWLGGVLSTAGLMGIVYAIMELPTHGLEAGVLIGLIGGIISLGAFIVWQLKTTHPMLDIRLFKRPAFGVSALAVTLAFFL
jgi:MFS family permease